jgi:hypothetical protein
MRASHCVIVGILLVAAICAVGGWKLHASDETKAKQVTSKVLPGNPMVGMWKSLASGKANDQPSDGLAMTFERDGTMQMTAQVTQTMGGRRSGFTWHCQGRYEFDGSTLERNFSSCKSCQVGGSCIELPLTQIPGGAKANFPVSFLTPNSVQIGTAILFADQRK